MNFKQWILLLFLYIIYLVIGAFTYMSFEQSAEEEALKFRSRLQRDIHDAFIKSNCSDIPLERVVQLLLELASYKGPPLAFNLDQPLTIFYQKNENTVAPAPTEGTEPPLCDPEGSDCEPEAKILDWNFSNAFFFCFTVVTTIGYGNISPTTFGGRMFTIPYCLIGIPLNGILIFTVGAFFSEKMFRRYQRSKKNTEYGGSRLVVVSDILFYLIPGFLVFIVLPAGCFVAVEDWSFEEAIYYAVVTLTTIGFGDYVAEHSIFLEEKTVTAWIYEVCLIVWIFFGLGYFVMIIDFITKFFRSRRLSRLEAKLRKKLPIKRDFKQLISVLRFNKVKPVYMTKEEKIRQKHEEMGFKKRKSAAIIRVRTGSDGNLPGPDRPIERLSALVRSKSETALDEIDRGRTFAALEDNRIIEGPLNLYVNLRSQMELADESFPKGVRDLIEESSEIDGSHRLRSLSSLSKQRGSSLGDGDFSVYSSSTGLEKPRMTTRPLAVRKEAGGGNVFHRVSRKYSCVFPGHSSKREVDVVVNVPPQEIRRFPDLPVSHPRDRKDGQEQFHSHLLDLLKAAELLSSAIVAVGGETDIDKTPVPCERQDRDLRRRSATATPDFFGGQSRSISVVNESVQRSASVSGGRGGRMGVLTNPSGLGAIEEDVPESTPLHQGTTSPAPGTQMLRGLMRRFSRKQKASAEQGNGDR